MKETWPKNNSEVGRAASKGFSECTRDEINILYNRNDKHTL